MMSIGDNGDQGRDKGGQHELYKIDRSSYNKSTPRKEGIIQRG